MVQHHLNVLSVLFLAGRLPPPSHLTWQLGVFWTEEIFQPHFSQFLLDAEAVLDAEAWQGHSKGDLPHRVDPVLQLVRRQVPLHLHQRRASFGQNQHHGDVVPFVRQLQHLDFVLLDERVAEPGLLVHDGDFAGLTVGFVK